MFDTSEIQTKIEKLPEHAKREVLEFVEILLNNYLISNEKQSGKTRNPLSAIAGFAENGKTDSEDTDNALSEKRQQGLVSVIGRWEGFEEIETVLSDLQSIREGGGTGRDVSF